MSDPASPPASPSVCVVPGPTGTSIQLRAERVRGVVSRVNSDPSRGYDIKLLRYLSVKYICDLMVENKKVKFGMK